MGKGSNIDIAVSDLYQFNEVGGLLYSKGYVSFYGGNLSGASEHKIIITKTGESLFNITKPALIGGSRNELIEQASSELDVHNEIYNSIGESFFHYGIVHAHPPHVVAASLGTKYYLEPKDIEGKYYSPRVLMVEQDMEEPRSYFLASIQDALKCPETKNSRLLVVRGHGVFAWGKTLRNAFAVLDSFELSMKILLLSKTTK